MVSLSDIEIGIGTSSWGPSLIWNFGDGYDASDLREAFTQIISHPNILLDTAEIYGLGQSEQFIGLFSEETGKRPFTATKFFPFPWRGHWRTLPNALRASIHRLKTAQVDLYQIHNRLPPVPIEVWIHGLAAVAEQGLTRAVGVSNYDVSHTKRAHTALRRRGLHLASNQVRYSLLDRRVERNGLLDTCREFGVRVIAYSPLERGLLSGKYTATKSPRGVRKWRYRKTVGAITPLIDTMRDIGRAYAEAGVVKTPAQVAINWCICKGTLPIPGAKNLRQAQANIGATGWRLAKDDVALLDRLSDEVQRKLIS